MITLTLALLLAAELPRDVEARLRAVPDPARIREYMKFMSAEPHQAGSPQSKRVAFEARDRMKSWGLDARIEEFEALLPAPSARLVEMIAPVKFTAKLAEPVVAGDEDSADRGQAAAFNAYSAAGDVTGDLVYVNFGMPEDYEQLAKLGVDVKGKIVLARYGGGWRGVKPKLAAMHGALACLIYSDPHEDGFFQGDEYPLGAWRPRDGVQRGSVMDLSLHTGDPLSPGWASERGSKRLALSEAKTLQSIPVLPLSWADALPLLEQLGGPIAPPMWRGSLPLTYHVGAGPARVRVKAAFEFKTGPLYNVIVRIPGRELPDEWILYGNHHDAWVNGASDPASGAAVLMETARAFSELMKTGWRPRRTIVFALWDGEEFGLLGSTEWVEKHAAELRGKAVAYFNSDMNGKGAFSMGASFTLEKFLRETARDVLGELPVGFRVSPLGSGSDYTAFVHHLGIASVNAGHADPSAMGVYHSIYDTFHWYTNFSDRDFSKGRALAQFQSAALFRMSEAAVLPFEFSSWVAAARQFAGDLPGGARIGLERVTIELNALGDAARNVDAKLASAKGSKELNRRLYQTERAMLLAGGLPGRPWYKHSLAAPGQFTGYAAKTLPGIREEAEVGRWEEAGRQVEAFAGVLKKLREELAAIERLM